MKLMKGINSEHLIVPADRTFADLTLEREAYTGRLLYAPAILAEACLANGLDATAILARHDLACFLIGEWYGAHRRAGGERNPVAEQAIAEASARLVDAIPIQGGDTPSPRTMRSIVAAGSAPQKQPPLPTGCVRALNATRKRTEADVLDLLTDAMVAAIARVPADVELWGVEDCARYLKTGTAAVQRLRNRADFPKLRKLAGAPLWIASEVIGWAKHHHRET
ncbi:MAG: hypothetical protein ABI831_07895 [Betaproteobacteria bacterium]